MSQTLDETLLQEALIVAEALNDDTKEFAGLAQRLPKAKPGGDGWTQTLDEGKAVIDRMRLGALQLLGFQTRSDVSLEQFCEEIGQDPKVLVALATSKDADPRVTQALGAATDTVNKWMADNIAMGGVCDFCSTPKSEYGPENEATYVTKAISGGIAMGDEKVGMAVTRQNFDPLWAACPPCAEAIERYRGKPAALADYMLKHRHANAGPLPKQVRPLFRQHLVKLYATMYGNGLEKASQPITSTREFLAFANANPTPLNSAMRHEGHRQRRRDR